ncbi:hypothetical protein H4R35_007180 [Dimargaris xerosporica]|nr:hypothetical protein H4R35_007180 [Dimargaris xerosporica]
MAEAASIIYIRHLTRPLNNEKLRALLATYGTFAFPEEATNAIRSLQGIVFPETTGRAIDLGSISETRMSQLIREEAQVLAQGLRKVEILDAPSDAPLEWGGIMLGDASDLAKSTAAAWERHDGRQAPQMDGDAAAAAKLPVIALEDLFCQTKTTPVLYYKPVFVPSTPSPKAL